MIKQRNPETGQVEIRGIQTNPNVVPATSHHLAKSQLPGGDRYTAFTKWRRRILAIILVVILVYVGYLIAVNMNAGGIIQAPDGPQESQVQTDFQKNAKANFDTLKYISDTSSGTPAVENIEVGRVVTNSGEVQVGYSCEVTADVKFSNSSINSTSKMRMKYAYNSLMRTWESGEITTEQANYRPNSGPDMQKIQDDAINLLSAYDESVATTMSGASCTRSGDISKDGGEVTLTLTKAGAGSDGADLVKGMTTKVEWSELSGWVASVSRVTTSGVLSEAEEKRRKEEEEAKKKEEEEKKKQEEEAKKKEEASEAVMELTCSSGTFVQLTGSVSGTTLTTEMTKYVIDGQQIVTATVNLTGNTSSVSGSSAATVNGYISVSGGGITVNIPN